MIPDQESINKLIDHTLSHPEECTQCDNKSGTTVEVNFINNPVKEDNNTYLKRTFSCIHCMNTWYAIYKVTLECVEVSE